MSSKTFKSAESDNRELEIDFIFGNPRLLVKDFDGDNKGFIFNKADAPALALAVLEAAFGDDQPAPNKIGEAWAALYVYIAEQERAYAEAKEQAELEAEALDYWKAYNNATELVSFDDIQWSDLLPESQAKWLAVARRAREMKRV